ncbi:MAG: hypothetical protein OEY01_02235, partial [Desulfobulbaceae bacterium]|nr:hypothetical protein [Desulfobulbaceae bacterium]HIJ78112.1 hypothetical protein [Deltaproteobacteria bacterium]
MVEKARDTTGGFGLVGDGTVEEYRAALKASPRFGRQVVYHHLAPAVSPVYGEPTSAWSDLLVAGLNSLGVEKLYGHQARAIDLVRQGGNVVVATPTASG